MYIPKLFETDKFDNHVTTRILPFLLRNLNAFERPNPLSPIIYLPSYSPYLRGPTSASDLTSPSPVFSPSRHSLLPQPPHYEVQFPHRAPTSPNACEAFTARCRSSPRSVTQYSLVYVTYRVSSETLTNENILQPFNI
jgi:hypothetical protein